MKLNDMMIQTRFLQRNPYEGKLRECRKYYDEHKRLDRDIVINPNGVLVDGYVGYLVLRENGVPECDVKVDDVCDDVECEPDYRYMETSYVVARHGNDPNEYIWRITDDTILSECIVLGSSILVESKNGNKVVTVVNMFTLDHPPMPSYVRKVLRCLIS